jgi:hypothetical protein
MIGRGGKWQATIFIHTLESPLVIEPWQCAARRELASDLGESSRHDQTVNADLAVWHFFQKLMDLHLG